jgi:hypothetical protein
MKLFRFTTKVEGMSEPMVDWYEGETVEAARVDYDEDTHRYGLPATGITVEIVECDPKTLMPTNGEMTLKPV